MEIHLWMKIYRLVPESFNGEEDPPDVGSAIP